MCQKQAVKFSHVIHMGRAGGREEGVVWGGGGWGGVTKAGLMLWQL